MPKEKTKKKVVIGVVPMSSVESPSFVTTGVKQIDELVGGYPRKRVSLIYGLAGVGKTTLMTKCLAEISKDHKVLYCDVENALNVDRVKELGADVSKIDYSNLSILEEVAELIRQSITKYDVIILDSVAMLTPKTEHDGEIGAANVGLKPRIIGQWLRMIEGDLGNTKCALVLVNQMRKTMELYGDKFILPGGLQLTFSSSLTLELNTVAADKIVEDGQRVGHWVTVRVKKSKVSMPFTETRFKLLYNT